MEVFEIKKLKKTGTGLDLETLDISYIYESTFFSNFISSSWCFGSHYSFLILAFLFFFVLCYLSVLMGVCWPIRSLEWGHFSSRALHISYIVCTLSLGSWPACIWSVDIQTGVSEFKSLRQAAYQIWCEKNCPLLNYRCLHMFVHITNQHTFGALYT